jgi:serine/threonine protein kinase
MASPPAPRVAPTIAEADLVFEQGLPVCPVGGFGRVVAARLRGRLVAVKSVKPEAPRGGQRKRLTEGAAVGLATGRGESLASSEAGRQLAAELAALTALKHPNIVCLVGVCYPSGVNSGQVWCVEELADGDLDDLMGELEDAGRRLTTSHILKLSLDMARGMHFMHASGKSHNDLKSANVLICKGSAILADFGLVHAFTQSFAGAAAITTAGPVGTANYMAPENMSGRDPNYRKAPADVFSFGCILYEMASGKRPWEDERWGMVEIMGAVLMRGERPSLAGLDATLSGIISRCWHADPAARPTAAALVSELTQLYAPKSIEAAQGAELEAVRALVEACSRNGIRQEYVRSLRNLEAFDIVLICDDSSSMALENTQGDGNKTTRWNELKETAKLVVDIAAAVDQDGADVYFLNRPALRSVKNAAAVAACFKDPPDGSTPLTRTLTQALHDKGYLLSTEAAARGAGATPTRTPDKRLLFIICTDGEPDEGSPAFISTLRALPENCYVQLLAVTDDKDAVGWMNQDMDGQTRNVDVNDVRCFTPQPHAVPLLTPPHSAQPALPSCLCLVRTTRQRRRRWKGSKAQPFPSAVETT